VLLSNSKVLVDYATYDKEPPEKWHPELTMARPANVPGGFGRPATPQTKPNYSTWRIKIEEEQMPQYKYTYIPPSDNDPWPATPVIAQIYLNSHRPTKDPPLPVWPSVADLDAARRKLNMASVEKVKYEDLVPPAGTEPKYMGNPGRLNNVQATDIKEANLERLERQRRREWVERAIRHGWEGYKLVSSEYSAHN